ncbi:MAG TPA: AAA family ATPase, partial [Bacteroidia bacterium]|nr:AAA family ATPase [Bacteroidia bacterium]
MTRIKKGVFGEELIDNNLALVINKKEKAPYVSPALIQQPVHSFRIQSPANLASLLEANSDLLDVKNTNGVIYIRCTNESPQMAGYIANSLANHFLGRTSELTDISGSNEELKQLDSKIETVANELATTENQIANYKKENQITELNFDTEKSLSVLKDLQLQKTQLEMNMATLDNISNYLRKNRDSNNSQIEYGAITDPDFSEQLSKLNEKYQSKAQQSATGETDSEIENLKSVISERILNTRKKTAIQLEEINRAIAGTQRQLSMIPEQANTLLALDRKLVLDKKVYDLMVEKRAQLIVSGGTNSAVSQLIKQAPINTSPVSTNMWMVICVGLLTGVNIGLILGWLREQISKSKIRQRDELNHLHTIPFIGNIANGNRNSEKWEESLNDLCTRILLKPETKMMTITSSVSGEGKTHIATHFSKTFAAMDKKVLVVDMNIFHPDVADHFEVTPERNLSDVLEGSCDIHDAISLTSYPNLDVLVSGNLSAGVNSLLASKKRNDIINDLRKHYDLIVIDTPGTANHIDAIPMMKISDLNLFVVRANSTRKQSVVNAGVMKTDYEIENLHFLLNSVTTKKNNNTDINIQRGSHRKMNSVPATKVDKDIVPSFLRKIALWFY